MGMIIWHICGDGEGGDPPPTPDPSQMFATGRNLDGELGIGSTSNVNVLTRMNQMPGGYEPVAILYGANHSIAIGEDGLPYGSGDNEFGQLGIVSRSQRTTYGSCVFDVEAEIFPTMNYTYTDANIEYDYVYKLQNDYSQLLVETVDGVTTIGVGNNDVLQLGVETDDPDTDEFQVNTRLVSAFGSTQMSTVDMSSYVSTIATTNADPPKTRFWGEGPFTAVDTADKLFMNYYAAFEPGGIKPYKIVCGRNHALIAAVEVNFIPPDARFDGVLEMVAYSNLPFNSGYAGPGFGTLTPDTMTGGFQVQSISRIVSSNDLYVAITGTQIAQDSFDQLIISGYGTFNSSAATWAPLNANYGVWRWTSATDFTAAANYTCTFTENVTPPDPGHYEEETYTELYLVGTNEYGQVGMLTAEEFTYDFYNSDPIDPRVEICDIWDNITDAQYDDPENPVNEWYSFFDCWAGEDFSIVLFATTGDFTEFAYYVTGRNDCGQLGLGDTTDRYGWTRLEFFDDIILTDLYVGLKSCVAQDIAGNVYVWGDNSQGTLGLGDYTNRTSPTLLIDVDTADYGWLIKGFGFGKLAMQRQQPPNMIVWGYNSDGQLTDDFPTDVWEPTVYVPFRVAYISGMHNSSSSLVIKEDGMLWFTGDNHYIQSSTAFASTIGGVSGDKTTWNLMQGSDWVQVDGYYDPGFNSRGPYVMGIRSDGTLWATGGYNDWQLGLGWTTPEGYTQRGFVPNFTQVGTDTDWAFVQCSWGQFVALKTNGDLYISGRVTEGANGNVMMHPENIARFEECVPGWNLPDEVGINWTYGVPMHAGAEQYKQIYSDFFTISGVTLAGGAVIQGRVTNTALDQGGGWYGMMGQWDMYTVPDFTSGCKKFITNGAINYHSFILMDNGDLYQAIGQLTVGTTPNMTPPLYVTRVPIASGQFSLINTGVEDIECSDVENVLFVVMMDGTAMVYPFDDTPPVPPEYDNWAYLGLGELGVAQLNEFTQIGTRENYLRLSSGGEHVLAMYGSED